MKLREKLVLSVFCFLFLPTFSSHAQIGIVDQDAKTKPTLVILGSYHMGTAGNNVVNPKVADITAPERQEQLSKLVQNLKQFKATKIVVECDLEEDAKTQESYNQYLSGNYQLTKNETNQIGFRLAKASGHKKVYCVDWSDAWDDPAINYIKYASEDAEMDSFLKKVNQKIKQEIDAEFKRVLPLSVTKQLIALNAPAQLENSLKFYFDLIRIGRGKDYIGANYVAWWYRRNLTILENIIRLTDSPNDRILVIYGVGHAKLLNQFANESGFYKVESPSKYLTGNKKPA